MALVLTLIAVAVGTGLGIRWGGDLSNVTSWRPPLWEALVGGIVLMGLVDLAGVTGGFATLLRIIATAAVLAFAVVNVRTGGMILIATGVALDLFVTVINWGMPVSGSALVRAGLVEEARLGEVVLVGGRSIAAGARLAWLGDVIALPWGQVISLGDVLVLSGTVLVTASVLRRMTVGDRHPGPRRRGSVGYADSLSALGRGPAPRRGPGLHPSRLGNGSDRRSGPRRGAPQQRGRAGGPRRSPGPVGPSTSRGGRPRTPGATPSRRPGGRRPR